MFNHSCLNNCTKFAIGNYIFIIATRNIEKGEEIMFSYVENLSTPKLKKQALRRFKFECTCDMCTKDEVIEDLKKEKSLDLEIKRY